MGWSDYWLQRADRTAARRKRLYGTDPPAPVGAVLARRPDRLGLGGSLTLLAFVLLRSPRSRLRFLWHYLADRDTLPRRRRVAALAGELRPALSEGCRVATDGFERRNYARDLASVPVLMERLLYRTTPLLVVQPRTDADLTAVAAFARAHDLAIFARGAASSAFGGAVPTRNGVVLDLSPMNEVIEIDAGARTARCRPGVRWADLDEALHPYGLVATTTPTSLFSTVAGWVCTGGFGLGSYAYGHLAESLVALRVMRADGTLETLSADGDGAAALRDLVGTEGQLGVIVEVTLRVRPRPPAHAPCLLTFDDLGAAMRFVRTLRDGGHTPAHVVVYDRARMAEENVLFRDRTGRAEPIVPEQDALLMAFEDEATRTALLESLEAPIRGRAEEARVAATWLWNERYFPLKGQRVAPTLLGAEVLLDPEDVAPYAVDAGRLAARFGLHPALEAIVCRDGDRLRCVVITSFACDRRRRLHYFLGLTVANLLTRLGVQHGGAPYGVGIWNTPFVAARFPDGRLGALQASKRALDPHGRLQPGKFFAIRGRFRSLTALPLQPGVHGALLSLALRLSSVLGWAARALAPPTLHAWTPPDGDDPGAARRLLAETLVRCTSCGACVSTCPAYVITGDELVTGRAKLRMAEAMLGGGRVDASEAHRVFQCLQCGLCEEACQTRLPLRAAYGALERWIEERYGPATATVTAFAERVDAERDRVLATYGLSHPAWKPGGGPR